MKISGARLNAPNGRNLRVRVGTTEKNPIVISDSDSDFDVIVNVDVNENDEVNGLVDIKGKPHSQRLSKNYGHKSPTKPSTNVSLDDGANNKRRKISNSLYRKSKQPLLNVKRPQKNNGALEETVNAQQKGGFSEDDIRLSLRSRSRVVKKTSKLLENTSTKDIIKNKPAVDASKQKINISSVNVRTDKNTSKNSPQSLKTIDDLINTQKSKKVLKNSQGKENISILSLDTEVDEKSTLQKVPSKNGNKEVTDEKKKNRRDIESVIRNLNNTTNSYDSKLRHKAPSVLLLNKKFMIKGGSRRESVNREKVVAPVPKVILKQTINEEYYKVAIGTKFDIACITCQKLKMHKFCSQTGPKCDRCILKKNSCGYSKNANIVNSISNEEIKKNAKSRIASNDAPLLLPKKEKHRVKKSSQIDEQSDGIDESRQFADSESEDSQADVDFSVANSSGVYLNPSSKLLAELDYETKDWSSVFNPDFKRKPRKATKQGAYRLSSGDSDEENGYDTMDNVILSEGEQERRILEGRVNQEYLAELEKKTFIPIKSRPTVVASEDEYSD